MNGYDDLGRPVKDLNFMDLCFTISKRSIDNSSKHGCIVVGEDGTILSTGYNNPIRNAPDKSIPMTRPEKYNFMEHAERNAIYNAARHGVRLHGSTFYITGMPCIDCLRAIIQVGAKRIVYGPNLSVSIPSSDIYLSILNNQTIAIERFIYDKELYETNPFARKSKAKSKVCSVKNKLEWFNYNPLYNL